MVDVIMIERRSTKPDVSDLSLFKRSSLAQLKGVNRGVAFPYLHGVLNNPGILLVHLRVCGFCLVEKNLALLQWILLSLLVSSQEMGA